MFLSDSLSPVVNGLMWVNVSGEARGRKGCSGCGVALAWEAEVLDGSMRVTRRLALRLCSCCVGAGKRGKGGRGRGEKRKKKHVLGLHPHTCTWPTHFYERSSVK